MLQLIFILSVVSEWGDINIIKSFAPVPEIDDATMIDPHFATWSEDGRLYLSERLQGKIHIWNKDGAYLKSFGTIGQGPGEFTMIQRMGTQGQQLWVYDAFGRKISIFDLDGYFQKSLPCNLNQVEAFAPIKDDLAILCYGKWKPDYWHRDLAFFKWNQKGDVLGEIISYEDEARLPGRKRCLFGPHPVIQGNGDGQWYLGYSNTNQMLVLNAKGEVIETKTYKFPKRSLPSPEEVEVFKNATLVAEGKRFHIYNPSFMLLDRPKAYYNHLLVGKTQIAFLLNINSGYFGNVGYHRGSFFVCDKQSGSFVGQGTYQLPEESMLLTGNGRAVAVISKGDDWSVHEVQLKHVQSSSSSRRKGT